MKAIAFTDGRGNAGNTGSCSTVIKYQNRSIEKAKRLKGEPTNNEAEYEGVRLACLTAIELGVTKLRIYSDSRLIVNQLNGTWNTTDKRMESLRDSIWKLANTFESISIEWIPRKENKHADSLCREVIKNPFPLDKRKNQYYKF